jgi:hypothetical protein
LIEKFKVRKEKEREKKYTEKEKEIFEISNQKVESKK